MPIALVGERLAGQGISFATLTANATTTATSSGTATAMITLGPSGYEGGTYLVLLSASAVTKGTTNVSLELWVDGVFGQSIVALLVNAVSPNPFFWAGLVALGPGPHTLTVRGFVDAGTGTIVAGTGATGQAPNAICRVIPA